MTKTAALLVAPTKPTTTPMAWTASELVKKIAKDFLPQTDMFRPCKRSLHKKHVSP